LFAVAFEANSRLRFLGEGAFADSSLLSIVIPKAVQVVDGSCFNQCRYLERVAFERNSELRIVKDLAFLGTAVTRIRIPAGAALVGSALFPPACAVLRHEGDTKVPSIVERPTGTAAQCISVATHVTNKLSMVYRSGAMESGRGSWQRKIFARMMVFSTKSLKSVR
jgi:hypothetical protein